MIGSSWYYPVRSSIVQVQDVDCVQEGPEEVVEAVGVEAAGASLMAPVPHKLSSVSSFRKTGTLLTGNVQ